MHCIVVFQIFVAQGNNSNNLEEIRLAIVVLKRPMKHKLRGGLDLYEKIAHTAFRCHGCFFANNAGVRTGDRQLGRAEGLEEEEGSQREEEEEGRSGSWCRR